MRVNFSAVFGAAVAAVAVAAAGAAELVQAVVAVSATCAFLAVLSQGLRARPSDWFTVRLLLAGNLVVFGANTFHRLGPVLAVFAIASGALLSVIAVAAYASQRAGRSHRRGRL